MKIERQDGEFKNFGELPVGACFLWEGHPCIRIKMHKTDNAVVLDNNEAIFIHHSVRVQIINAKVVIYGD